ncbi:MAG TPA: hypothetical protein VFJ16_03935 [Longimicrobium sp.]|nr:hypothetical protein [Longimicrobium sp.]
MAKDAWEKADVISKFVSGVALAALTLVLKCGADRIANSQREGDLVARMISDLASPDTSIRKDLAILALNHAIPRPEQEDSDLVADLSVRVLRSALRDTLAARGYDATELFHILSTRAPGRAERLQDEFKAAVAATPPPVDTARVPGGSNPPAAVAAAAVNPVPVAAVLGHVVYLQFQGDPAQRATMNALMAALNAHGLNAPGVERVPRGADNTVRYFHGRDRALADTVAAVVARTPGLPRLRVGPARYAGPLGQIEVWVRLPATQAPPGTAAAPPGPP